MDTVLTLDLKKRAIA